MIYLKKSEQVPVDQEQHFLLEDLYKSVEKMEETQEMNMTNKVNIEFLRDQLEKALKDIEDLKDKVRANIGSSINSQHAKAEAADFECIGVDNAELADWIKYEP